MEPAKAEFRKALIKALRSTSSESFNFTRFVEQHGVSRDLADDVAQEVFRRLCIHSADDGVVTADEQARIDKLGRALEISAAAIRRHTCGECGEQFDNWRTELKRVPFKWDDEGTPTEFRNQPHYFCPHCGATRWSKGRSSQRHDHLPIGFWIGVLAVLICSCGTLTRFQNSKLREVSCVGFAYSMASVIVWLFSIGFYLWAKPDESHLAADTMTLFGFVFLAGGYLFFVLGSWLAGRGVYNSAKDMKQQRRPAIAGLLLGLLGLVPAAYVLIIVAWLFVYEFVR